MKALILHVSDEDAKAILEHVTKDAPKAPNGHHRVFITSSVPALHMWNVESVETAEEFYMSAYADGADSIAEAEEYD